MDRWKDSMNDDGLAHAIGSGSENLEQRDFVDFQITPTSETLRIVVGHGAPCNCVYDVDLNGEGNLSGARH